MTLPAQPRAHLAHGIVWLRRDLRLDDHLVLALAAEQCERVTVAFVLDPDLLRGPRVGAPIVQAFFTALADLRADLRALGSELVLLEGDFAQELIALARRVGAHGVFYGEDYDPAMRARDACVEDALRAVGIHVQSVVDHVYAPAGTIIQATGKPYTVFTPFRRRWEAWAAESLQPPVPSRAAIVGKLATGVELGSSLAIPTPESYGHASSPDFPTVSATVARELLERFIGGPIEAYSETRNFPALAGTSHLSPHLRAGTIGIRTCFAAAFHARDRVWLSELIWREFYQHLLVHFPHVAEQPFVVAAQAIPYRDDPAAFEAWCAGRTGYPIVDAGMRELRATGWMHNRTRMIVASFLTKHLLLDYRWGERWFERWLADADLGANNGGWQWSSSTGTDAAPYFRVFNPILQGQRFDPEGAYVRRWVPELRNVPTEFIHAPWEMPPLVASEAGCVVGQDYPQPIVEHAFARIRAIEVYGAVLGSKARVKS